MKAKKNRKENRKGVIHIHLVGAILGLVFVLILVYFGYKVYNMITERNPVEACKLSVAAKAVTTVGGAEVFSPFKDLNCDTTRITISEKGIKSSKPGQGKKFSDDKSENSEFVNKVVADELHDCWYQFGEGKINFWGDFDAGKRCVICSDIRFDKSVRDRDKLPPTIDDFGKFLFTDFKPGSSYYDFLVSGSVGAAELPFSPVIDTSKEYSVLHITAKRDLKEKFLIDTVGTAFLGCKVGSAVGALAASWTGPGAVGAGAVGGAVGCVGGFVTGVVAFFKTKEGADQPYIVGVRFTDTENINEACDRLY